MSERSLGDLAELTVGYVGPMADRYVNTGIPFLRTLNLEPFRINLSGVKFIDQTFHENLKKSALQPGDVVIARTGNPGTAAVIPPDLAVANCSDLVIVRPGPELDPAFLAYYINGVAKKFIYSRTVGAVQQHFNIGQAREIPIPALGLHEQRRIAGVLGALDSLIEVNHQLARHCDELADALWHEATSGAPSEIRIADCATVVLGGTPSRKESSYWGGDVPWLNSGEANEFRVLGPSEFITTSGLSKSSTKMMPKGATIIAITGATLGQVSRIEIPACGNQSLVGVWSEESALNDFIYFGVRNRVDLLIRSATGGAQQHVNKANVEELTLPWIAQSEIDAWHQVASPLLSATAELLFEAQTLANTRDELLPLLMSGRVRVREDGVAA